MQLPTPPWPRYVDLVLVAAALFLLGWALDGYAQVLVAGVGCSVLSAAIVEIVIARNSHRIGPNPPPRPRKGDIWEDTSVP